MKLSIIGVYPEPSAEEPCHLVELRVDDSWGSVDISSITQRVAGQPRGNWQVPYDEYALNADGTLGEACFGEPIAVVNGGARVAFFFHYLDLHEPLITPSGNIELPAEAPRPDRLSFMVYQQP